METLRKELTPEERQANVDALIHRWKDEKRKSIAESKANYQKPEVQAIFQKLREQNARERASIGV
jgi:hypothetical protein